MRIQNLCSGVLAMGLAVLMPLSATARADAMFTPEEFSAVATEAVAQFKVDLPEHYSMFWGLSMVRDVQGDTEIGLKVTVYMQMGAGSPSVAATYLCHKHDDGDIHCHTSFK